MADALRHRGPDEEGFLLSSAVSFGMRRLSILDIEGGQQPVFSEDRSVAVVYNGEIFNFQELRQELLKKGHKLLSRSDTEIITHLYEEEGLDFPKRLNGMFAIALWDAKRERIVLARDQIGIKPLYYFFKNKKLIFGSEIKAILKHPSVHKEINPSVLPYYFAFKHIPTPATIYRDIAAVLPGEVLIFEKGKLEKSRYWKLKSVEGITSGSSVHEKIIDLLRDSVRRRLVADVPVGSYLSGGLDSSLVTALAAQESKRPIKTFSLTYADNFPGKRADQESAQKVSQLFQTDHYEFILRAKELERDLPEIIASFDEPFAGVVSTYFISKLIKKHVKVALSGDGADELFGSYLSHRLASGSLERPDLEVENRHPWKWRNSLLVGGGNRQSEDLLKKGFLKFPGNDLLNRTLATEFTTIFPDQVLAFVDRLSMAHSIEVRPPYLDLRLVELAFSLPGRYKIKNGEAKYLLKKAAEGILPKEVIYRPKEGFIMPINAWLAGALRPMVLSLLSARRVEKHGFFSRESIRKLLARKDWHATDVANRIWTLVNFQIWWERCIS